MFEVYPEYYLLKVNQFNDVAKDTLDEWIYFLKKSEICPDFKARGIHKAEEVLNMLKLDPEERQAYERYQEDLHYQASMFYSSYGDGRLAGKEEGIEEGEQIGLQKGEQIGLQKAKIQMVQSMKQEGLPLTMIMKLTGLSEEELRRL